MSERKVLNKYYPPDFDPSKVPRGKRNKNATFNIRIMAPFNMRCNMCKDYIYKGKKFNSRKEDVMDEDYLGLRIFRFYIKCPRCVSEIAFKTDLKNTDYTLEAGAIRLFEADKIAQQMAEQERKEKEEDELNPMKVLENRTKQSQLEMEQIDSLEEIREMNLKKNAVNTDDMIERYRKYEELLLQLQIEEEEKEIKEIFGTEGSGLVKRLHDSDSEEEEPKRKTLKTSTVQSASATTANATDILTNTDEPKVTKTKTPEVWEKSVGGMSSKSKLSGLVIKKKTTKLPPFTVSSSADCDKAASKSIDKDMSTDKDKAGTSNSKSGTSKSTFDSSNDSQLPDSNQKCNSDKNVYPNEGKQTEGVQGEKLSVNENSVSTEVQPGKSGLIAGKPKPAEMKVEKPTGLGEKPTGLGGLGMLGAYSSDESENSD